MKSMAKLLGQLLLCCLGWGSALAAPRVAVYKEPAALASREPSRSDKIAEALNSQEGLEAALVGAIDATTLNAFQALILPNEGGSHQALKEHQVFLRQWVADGHGLLTTHDAVGYRNHIALFPEIAVGSGNFYTTQQAYKNEFCIVAEHPALTAGLSLKQRHTTSYYDLITLSPGPKGHVVARAVARSGKGLFSGAPAVAVGQVGKGRYVACGLLPGGLAPKATPVAPKGGERQLLLNLTRFMLGQGELSGLSEDLGPNAYLGAAPVPERPWEKSLPGLSVEQLLAQCQITMDKTTWKDSLRREPLTLSDIEPGSPAIDPQLLGFYTNVEPYNPVPASWPHEPVAPWKYLEIRNTADNPADDAGTAGGYWKPDVDDHDWADAVETYKARWDPGVRWYRAHIALPPAAPDARTILCFEGVDDQAVVYVNGQKVGAHEGTGIPFELDISAAAKPGADNVIALRNYDPGIGLYIESRGSPLNGLYGRVSIQIRPEVYAERLLIDPKPEDSSIEVLATLRNGSPQARELEMSAEVVPYAHLAPWITGRRKATRASLGKLLVAPGTSQHRFKVTMKRPELWTPETPFLYVLNLRGDGTDLAQERFGFRTFVQEGRFFLLNGKRVFLRGAVVELPPLFSGNQRDRILNEGRLWQRVLLAYKALNFNNLNPQGIGAHTPREFYDNCDEIGMLLYDLNPYINRPYEKPPADIWLMARLQKEAPDDLKLHPAYLPNIERYFLRNYNHPSYVMFAISSESRYPVYRKALHAAYDRLKRIDGQGRPICPCSGDAPSQTAFTFSDVSDLHAYPGDINGHPWDHKQLLYDFNETTWEYLGKNLPVINYEAGGAFHVVWPRELKPIRELWTKETPDKAAIIRNIEGKDADYNMPLNARWLLMYGVRRYVIEDYNRAEKEKRPISSYRQEYTVRNQIASSRLAGDLFQGYGINFGRFYTSFAIPSGPPVPGAIRFEFSDLRFFWHVGKPMVENPIVAANGFNAFRRYSNPKLVVPDLLQSKNAFAGQPFRTTVYAINDTGDDSKSQTIRIALYEAKDNRRLLDRTAAIGRVPAGKRKLVPFEWLIPAEMPTSTVRLELFLIEAGKTVSDSACEFHVLGRDLFADRISANGKRVALYDSAAANGSPERSTGAVIDRLGIPYKRIEDPAHLEDFDVLIIGAASADNRVYKANSAIAEWLERGGRMIQFERAQPGAVAGVPKLNIVRKMGGSVVEPLVPAHPVFEGLQVNDYWNLWNGNLPEAQGYGREGGLYSSLIGPLNETAVAVGLIDVPRANPKSAQMAIADVKVGKGVALINQTEATLRYGRDAVATKFIQNAFRYILSDETSFSTPLSDFTINPLDFYNFGFVEMKNLANAARVFPQDWLDMVESGFHDLGQLRFRLEKGKVLRLTDGADRAVVKLPEGMPLMFPDREKEKVLKDRDQGTLNRGMFDALYLLYAAGKTGDGAVVGTCTLRYKDGTAASSDFSLGKNIGLDGKQDSLDDGKAVGFGMYVTRLVNPSQGKEVDTIELRAAPGCELLVAGVTASLAREKVHD